MNINLVVVNVTRINNVIAVFCIYSLGSDHIIICSHYYLLSLSKMNKSKIFSKQMSCKCECKFGGSKCNSNQKWNNVIIICCMYSFVSDHIIICNYYYLSSLSKMKESKTFTKHMSYKCE